MARKPKAFRQRKRRKRRAHTIPGTLEVPPDASQTQVRVFRYDADNVVEHVGLAPTKRSAGVTWVDVVGLGDLDMIRRIGKRFRLHPLALEDVLSPGQRAKVEDYSEHLFIVLRALRVVEGQTEAEQISMFLGDGFVVTFQEREGDSFEPLRDRIREKRGRVRTQGSSYLAYALLDAMVDAMFPVLERYEDRLEVLEDRVFDDADAALLQSLHGVDRAIAHTRRTLRPLREAIGRLVRDPHDLISEDTRTYLRDCRDHVGQLVDQAEAQREFASSLSSSFVSNLSFRSGEITRVLTIIATIFIPLSFVAGLYGMNFNTEASPWNMPELHWAYGYPCLLGFMATMALGMLSYFRRRRWL